MTENDATDWMERRFGGPAVERVARFLDMVRHENAAQNLVSPGSIAAIWARHAVDSAQLLSFAPEPPFTWLDIGTGGGFPGMIVALLTDRCPVVMVEPRKRRAAFLSGVVEAFDLDHADIRTCRVEGVTDKADVISARAVAQPQVLLAAAAQCATPETTWLFPRGGSTDHAVPSGQVLFHVEQSVSDERSVIHVGRGQP